MLIAKRVMMFLMFKKTKDWLADYWQTNYPMQFINFPWPINSLLHLCNNPPTHHHELGPCPIVQRVDNTPIISVQHWWVHPSVWTLDSACCCTLFLRRSLCGLNLTNYSYLLESCSGNSVSKGHVNITLFFKVMEKISSFQDMFWDVFGMVQMPVYHHNGCGISDWVSHSETGSLSSDS